MEVIADVRWKTAAFVHRRHLGAGDGSMAYVVRYSRFGTVDDGRSPRQDVTSSARRRGRRRDKRELSVDSGPVSGDRSRGDSPSGGLPEERRQGLVVGFVTTVTAFVQ